MINRQQALEIIEKFDFFQGQRAGRELWADKPREVQEDDLIHFQVDCELLKEFIESQPERPKGRWIGIPRIGVHDMCCSNCRYSSGIRFWNSPYCPNCGAEMER